MKRGMTIMVAVGLLVGIRPLLAQTGGGYDLTWSTIDGGGGTSTGGGYSLSGTIGQPDASAASALTGGDLTLTGGFWGTTLPACTSFVPADFDQDCDVDGDDFAAFEACLTGPEVFYDPQALPPGCNFTPVGNLIAPDLDGDGDTDQLDFGLFQRCYSGPNILADPACAN